MNTKTNANDKPTTITVTISSDRVYSGKTNAACTLINAITDLGYKAYYRGHEMTEHGLTMHLQKLRNGEVPHPFGPLDTRFVIEEVHSSVMQARLGEVVPFELEQTTTVSKHEEKLTEDIQYLIGLIPDQSSIEWERMGDLLKQFRAS